MNELLDVAVKAHGWPGPLERSVTSRDRGAHHGRHLVIEKACRHTKTAPPAGTHAELELSDECRFRNGVA